MRPYVPAGCTAVPVPARGLLDACLRLVRTRRTQLPDYVEPVRSMLPKTPHRLGRSDRSPSVRPEVRGPVVFTSPPGPVRARVNMPAVPCRCFGLRPVARSGRAWYLGAHAASDPKPALQHRALPGCSASPFGTPADRVPPHQRSVARCMCWSSWHGWGAARVGSSGPAGTRTDQQGQQGHSWRAVRGSGMSSSSAPERSAASTALPHTGFAASSTQNS